MSSGESSEKKRGGAKVRVEQSAVTRQLEGQNKTENIKRSSTVLLVDKNKQRRKGRIIVLSKP